MQNYFYTMAFFILAIVPAAHGQQRNLPEEVKALAVVCSSSASVDFKGELEGGINRLLGKILSGTGELSISKSEEDFLSSFQDEKLKIVARKAYNDCVIEALKIVYNKRVEGKSIDSDGRIVVFDPLTTIKAGNQFAVKSENTVRLENGEVFSISVPSHFRGSTLIARINHKGRTKKDQLEVGEQIHRRDGKCWITYYSQRDDVYSFLYECN